MKGFNLACAAGVAAISLAMATLAQAKDVKDISVAVIPKVAVPFFDDCNNGAKTAADKLSVNYQWVVPQNTQGSTQVQIIEDLISNHVDGIAISVNEPKWVESVMKRAEKSSIKVLTDDPASPKIGLSVFIGTSNVAAGEAMAETMAKALNGNGDVAIVTGQLGAVNLNERISGIKQGL